MIDIYFYFALSCIIQILHSLEEIFTHFEKRWPLWKMERITFVSFEILFTLLFLSIFILNPISGAFFIKIFMLIMFANGIWHLFWAGSEKKYVPGLITAPLHIINFIFYYSYLQF